MSTLFVVGRPLETETLTDTMLGLISDGEEVHVIFIRSGVGNASDESLVSRMNSARSLSCLDANSEVVEGVERVDYDGWVHLIEGCEKIVSWT